MPVSPTEEYLRGIRESRQSIWKKLFSIPGLLILFLKLNFIWMVITFLNYAIEM